MADGEPGEVTVTAEFVPAGYHNDPERTAQVFRREPDGRMTCAHGDLAYRDHEGVYHSFGRKDQQIKIRGYNVRPPEVEQLLLEHEAVQAVAVAPFEGRQGIRRLACYFVRAAGAEVSGQVLRQFLLSKVPNYMVPGVFIELDALPVTVTGKINRKELPDPLSSLSGRQAQTVSPRNETERVLVEAWADVLGHGDFDLDDDFFDLGDDSLQAMAMLVASEAKLKIRVPLEALILNGATITTLGQRIDAGRSLGGANLPIVMKRGGSRAPFFAAHVMGGHLSDYLALQHAMHTQQPLFGLHPKGMDGISAPDTSIPEIAATCVRSMRLQQPEGPYRIMGYSFGGYVAYEMACQLTEAGQEVSHLVLLDPGVTWLERLRFVKAVYRPLRYERDTKKSWSRLTGAVPFALGMRTAPTDLDEAHFAALLKYRPKPVALQNVLFVTALENKQRGAIRDNWRKLIGPGVTFVDATGDHAHMVREPNIWAMAQKIEGWLDRGTSVPPESRTARAEAERDATLQDSARAA